MNLIEINEQVEDEQEAQDIKLISNNMVINFMLNRCNLGIFGK